MTTTSSIRSERPTVIKTSAFFIDDNGTKPGTNRTKRILAGLTFAAVLLLLPYYATAGQAPVPLGSATTFRVLARSTVTSTGDTALNGRVGVSRDIAVTG